MSKNRQLAAILFADIVGYTGMMQEDEKTARQLLEKFRSTLNEEVENFQGEIVHYYGDGCLSTFSSDVNAVACAKKIQGIFQSEPYVPARIGLHSGDVFFEAGNVYGDSVNIASRIESLGVAGSVLFSKRVKRDIGNQAEFNIKSLGKFHFKNVAKTMEVFALANDGLVVPKREEMLGKLERSPFKTKARLAMMGLLGLLTILLGIFLFNQFSTGGTVSSSGIEKSIAVLPFRVIGDDKEGQYFADGVMDVLINNLNKIEGLQVRSRTSVERYSGTRESLENIGEQLRVKYIIEGSAQKYKDDIRIIVKLINVQTDAHLWDEKYERKFEDIFKVQSEIALKITEEMGVVFSGEDQQAIEAGLTSDKEAYDLYLKGRYYLELFWKFREPSDIDFAIRFFDQALEKDPEFPAALSSLGNALINKNWFQLENKPTLQDSIYHLLNKAIKLAPESGTAHYAMSSYYMWGKRDSEQALKYGRKAVALEPLNQENYITLISSMSFIAGLFDDKRELLDSALIYSKKALSLEPCQYYPHILQLIGKAYIDMGELPLAETFLTKALELQPDHLDALSHLMYVKISQRKFQEALKLANQNIAIRPDNQGLVDRGKVYLMMGEYERSEADYRAFLALPDSKSSQLGQERHAYAYALRKNGKEREALRQIELSRQYIVSQINSFPYDIAKLYSFLGEKEKALDALEDFIPYYSLHHFIDIDPLFDNIREEPRFRAVVKRSRSYGDSLHQIVQRRITEGLYPTPEMVE